MDVRVDDMSPETPSNVSERRFFTRDFDRSTLPRIDFSPYPISTELYEMKTKV